MEVGGMDSRQQQEHIHKEAVKKLDNDYVRSNEGLVRQRQLKQRNKVIARRRLTVFFTLAVVVCLFLTWGLFKQNDRLAAKQAQKVEAEQQLAQVEEQQELLNLQIAKLEDDEYIAKLARKEYFLSEEGEIIFTIPTQGSTSKDDKKDEKTD